MADVSKKHELVLRAAAAAIKQRGHEGDARLADSVLGVLSALQAQQGDEARLDFVLEKSAWVQWIEFDSTFKRAQLWTQDEDENYIVLSGDAKSFGTAREAIDAAMLAARREG